MFGRICVLLLLLASGLSGQQPPNVRVQSNVVIVPVPVKDAGDALQFGIAQTLVANWTAPQVFYDISPDGKKILLDRVSQQVSQAVTVVTNFTAGLKK